MSALHYFKGVGSTACNLGEVCCRSVTAKRKLCECRSGTEGERLIKTFYRGDKPFIARFAASCVKHALRFCDNRCIKARLGWVPSQCTTGGWSLPVVLRNE